jgi:hypothetical protein
LPAWLKYLTTGKDAANFASSFVLKILLLVWEDEGKEVSGYQHNKQTTIPTPSRVDSLWFHAKGASLLNNLITSEVSARTSLMP